MPTNICEKLKNLFEKHTNYNSFACSAQNQYGLKLNIIQDGDSCYSDFKLDRMYTGFPNIIHGGIQATIIDEIGFWAMFNKYKTVGLTTKLSIEYLNKVEPEINLKALVTKIIKSDLDVNVEVHIKTNNLTLVVGSLTYKLISDILLKRYFGEKFYTEFIKIKNEYN